MVAATDTMTLRLRILLGIASVAAAVLLVAPRSSAGLVAALTAVLLSLAALERPRLPRSLAELPLWTTVALAFAAYLLVTVIWSVDRFEGVSKVSMFAALAAAIWLASVALPAVEPELRAELVRGIVIAICLGAAYLCLEELTDHAIKTFVFGKLPSWARPDARHLRMSAGEVEGIEGYISDRNMAALMLVAWPAMLGAMLTWPKLRGRLVALGLAAVVALAVTRSQHTSSQVAIVVSAAVLAIAFVNARIAAGVLAAAWIASCLFVVPAADYAFRVAGWHQASWLPRTARQRIILWGYTASLVPARPLLGVGIASTKPLDDARRVNLTKPQGFDYELRTGPHSHNVYLQSWYELGAIGALLFMALGLCVLRAITRTAPVCQPFLLAGFATAAVLMAFTWGMWQAWFMGSFAFAALVAMLVAKQAETKRS